MAKPLDVFGAAQMTFWFVFFLSSNWQIKEIHELSACVYVLRLPYCLFDERLFLLLTLRGVLRKDGKGLKGDGFPKQPIVITSFFVRSTRVARLFVFAAGGSTSIPSSDGKHLGWSPVLVEH